MVQVKFCWLLLIILCKFSNGDEDSSDILETGQYELFDNSELAKLANKPNGNVVVQIVNYGTVGFLNSDEANKSGKPKETARQAEQINEESNIVDVDPVPPHENAAAMARYIVKHSNWTSVATISTREPTKGYPSNNIVSVSDGPVGKSTGVPYMYVTSLDISQRDLQVDPRASLTMTLAQTDYCREKVLDPEDPRCAHVILTGEFVKIQNGTQEAAFAEQALFTKHPVMSTWPPDHGFFFAKLHISNIIVLDYFGGAVTVDPKAYFKATIY